MTYKLKYDEKDLKLLNSKVNEQIQIIELAYDTVAGKTKEFSVTKKELADLKVKIVELDNEPSSINEPSIYSKSEALLEKDQLPETIKSEGVVFAESVNAKSIKDINTQLENFFCKKCLECCS